MSTCNSCNSTGYVDLAGARLKCPRCGGLGHPTTPSFYEQAASTEPFPSYRNDTTSRHFGVSWYEPKKQWAVIIWDAECRRSIHLGYYDDEDIAGRIAAAARKQQVDNWLGEVRDRSKAEPKELPGRPGPRGASGIQQDATNGNWKARIYAQGRRIFLGSFKTREEALDARKQAELVYHKHYKGAGV